MRQGELFSLEWGDVDLEHRHVVIRGCNAKSGGTRFIPLNSEVLTVLQLFVPIGGTPITWADVKESREVGVAFSKISLRIPPQIYSATTFEAFNSVSPCRVVSFSTSIVWLRSKKLKVSVFGAGLV